MLRWPVSYGLLVTSLGFDSLGALMWTPDWVKRLPARLLWEDRPL